MKKVALNLMIVALICSAALISYGSKEKLRESIADDNGNVQKSIVKVDDMTTNAKESNDNNKEDNSVDYDIDLSDYPKPTRTTAKDVPNGRTDKETADWDIKKLDVARNVSYLTEAEKDVILELNKVRSNPKKYAELYIQPMLKYFNGNKYSEPGKITILTQEGTAAVQECVTALSNAESIGILTPEKGLYLAAKDHAADQSKTGQTGHVGTDGSKMSDRAKRYGDTHGALGETISYGRNTGLGIIVQLLVDDGVPSRGHRAIIMNGTYTQAGLSVGTHPKYGNTCVIVYAKGYTSNK